MSRAMGVVGFFPGDTMTILKCISSVVDRGLVLISSLITHTQHRRVSLGTATDLFAFCHEKTSRAHLANAAWVRSGLLGGEGLFAMSLHRMVGCGAAD